MTLLPMDKENKMVSEFLKIPVVVKFDVSKQGKMEPLLREVDLDDLIPALEELLA